MKLNRYSISNIDKLTTTATQSMCKINWLQMQQLQSCIWTKLDSSIFAIKLNISNIFNPDFVDPVIGTYTYGSERIPWTSYAQMISDNVSEPADHIS